jgi:hypothetical protein
MKKIIKNSIILFCMLIHTLGTKLNSQPQPEFICGTCKEHTEQSMLSSQNNSLSKVTAPFGGDRRRIETTGTLKILIIFAQFNGDNSDVANWPSGSFPTYLASNIIDSTVKSTYSAYTPFSVSSFFKEMSNGAFNVVGKVFPKFNNTQ